jgi:4-hydroxy-tetrahydrodipicolinate reductase
MGQRLVQMIASASDLRLAAAVDRPDHPSLGCDAGTLAGVATAGVPLSTSLDGAADVAIDFSAPAASALFCRACADRNLAIVVGTTGFDREERAILADVASRVPILVSANFSRAVNVLAHLTALAARLLGPDADVEIVERHHRTKKDAPSGTALRLADAVAGVRGIGQDQYAYGRQGQTGERPSQQIALHALRTGDNPGEHTVVFGLMGECLELSHRALNRDGFARGALDAARFLAGKPPGAYSMRDVLGLGET